MPPSRRAFRAQTVHHVNQSSSVPQQPRLQTLRRLYLSFAFLLAILMLYLLNLTLNEVNDSNNGNDAQPLPSNSLISPNRPNHAYSSLSDTSDASTVSSNIPANPFIHDLRSFGLAARKPLKPLKARDRTAAEASDKRRPNIIFVLSDDQGWDDVEFHNNSQARTPNLVDLFLGHKGGVELTQHYAQCVCTPSRGALLTGLYPIHTGLTHIAARESQKALAGRFVTLAEVLRDLGGYETHLVGKWHLGFHRWEQTPTFRGFDQFYGFYTGAEDYYTHVSAGVFDFREEIGPNCGQNCSRVAWEASGTYSTMLFDDYVRNRILSKHSSVSNVSNVSNETEENLNEYKKPFFLLLSYQSVHSPLQVPARFEAIYNKSVENIERRRFGGMISCLDESVGNITNELKKLGLFDNTIIVFASDNGGATMTADGVGSKNYPLRGGKHSIFEGGTRVVGGVYIPPRLQNINMRVAERRDKPWHATLSAVAAGAADATDAADDAMDSRAAMGNAAAQLMVAIESAGGEISHRATGRLVRHVDGVSIGTDGIIHTHARYDNLMHIIDWLPTLMDAAQIEFEFDPDKYPIDGVSHWNALLAQAGRSANANKLDGLDEPAAPREVMYYGHNVPNGRATIGSASALRVHDLKIIKSGSGGDPKGWNLPAGYEPNFNANIPPSGAKKLDLSPKFKSGHYSLYNLTDDPVEYFDIAHKYPEVTAAMARMLNEFEETKEMSTDNRDRALKQCGDAKDVWDAKKQVRGPWCWRDESKYDDI